MITNPKQIYAMRIAEDARKECENKNIIDRKKLILDLKDLKNILNFFRIDLKEDKQKSYNLSRSNDEYYDFIIYHTFNKIINSKVNIDKLKILTGLGEIFLREEEIGNDIYNIADPNLGAIALHSETFARAFLMPKELFENQMINNSFKGKINVTSIANAFEVDYMDAVARGSELQLIK